MPIGLQQQLRPVTIAGRPLPLMGKARIYVCGVTPYDVTHLGHAATYVWVDVVGRLLRHLGTDVEVCRNVTDVDDVLLAAARRAGAPYDAFAAVQQYQFEQDMAALGRPPPDARAARAQLRAPSGRARRRLWSTTAARTSATARSTFAAPHYPLRPA